MTNLSLKNNMVANSDSPKNSTQLNLHLVSPPLETLAQIPHFQATNCAAITRQSGSNFAVAFGLLSKEKAKALSIVYAFFRIADDCVDSDQSSAQKKTALDYWKNQIELAYNNLPDHTVICELKTVIDRYQIPKEYFLGLIEGCAQDIEKTQFDTFDDLYKYCYRVAGLVGLTCLKIFEYESQNAEKMAVNLGIAFQLTNIMRDVKGDLQLGRIYLPIEDLKRYGYTLDDLKNLRETAAFFAYMRELAKKAELYYQVAFAEFRNDTEGKLIAAKAMARLYHKILEKIVRKKFPVLRKKIGLNVFQKIGLLLPFYFRKK